MTDIETEIPKAVKKEKEKEEEGLAGGKAFLVVHSKAIETRGAGKRCYHSCSSKLSSR